jgi:hypothetical protein
MNTVKVHIDPTSGFEGIKPSKLLEATGLLPHFAADVAMSEPESVQEAFDMLMECYQYGMGQDGTGWGTVDEDGMYISEHKEDPDMAPLVTFGLTDEINFNVYQYAICAVTDGTETLMMRMD